MVAVPPFPVNVYHTPGEVFVKVLQVGALSDVELSVYPERVWPHDKTMAFEQRSFTGTGRGVLKQMLNEVLLPVE